LSSQQQVVGFTMKNGDGMGIYIIDLMSFTINKRDFKEMGLDLPSGSQRWQWKITQLNGCFNGISYFRLPCLILGGQT
jgi:hypothetical protein